MSTVSPITVPEDGARIVPGEPVPDNPIIPFIEGDGIGVDITPVMKAVVDAAVDKAYGGARAIRWMEIYAGEKATRLYGADVWLPSETLDAVKEFVVAIKGPMTTPVGGGIRSLNVALRQELDLYVCLRPVRWFRGVPSPLKDPSQTDMVIFRENTEDIYAGIEWEAESEGARRVIAFLQEEMGVRKIRFPDTSGIGVKPVSREGTERLVRKAIRYAIDNERRLCSRAYSIAARTRRSVPSNETGLNPMPLVSGKRILPNSFGKASLNKFLNFSVSSLPLANSMPA